MTHRYANESLPDLTAAMSGFRAVVSAPRPYAPTPVRAAARPTAPARAAAAPSAPPSPPRKKTSEELARALAAAEARLFSIDPELARQCGIGLGQRASNASRLDPEAKRALDLKMGLIVPTNGVISTPHKLTLGATKNLAAEFAARPAPKASKPVASAQAPEAAAELRRRMGLVAATDGVVATPYKLSLGVMS